MSRLSQQQIYRSMALRRLALFGGGLGLGVLLALAAIAKESNPAMSAALGAVGGIAFLGYAVLALFAWRCPACNRFLGRRWFITVCPGCRATIG